MPSRLAIRARLTVSVHGQGGLVAVDQSTADQHGKVLEENHPAHRILRQDLIQLRLFKLPDLDRSPAFRRGRVGLVLRQAGPTNDIARGTDDMGQEPFLPHAQPDAPLAQNVEMAGRVALTKQETALRVRFLPSRCQDLLTSLLRDSRKQRSSIDVHGWLLPQNSPETFPVLTSTSTRRKPGFEDVPGIKLIVPAHGQRNFAPEYTRTSRMGSTQPSGTPLSVGSWLKLRCVFTIMVA